MRHLIATALFFISFGAAAQLFTMMPREVVVVQINAKWNESNTRTDLEDLDGCEYRFGWLEEQPLHLRETIRSLPVVVIYRDGHAAWQFAADISFRLDTPFEEIQKRVYEIKY